MKKYIHEELIPMIRKDKVAAVLQTMEAMQLTNLEGNIPIAIIGYLLPKEGNVLPQSANELEALPHMLAELNDAVNRVD